MKSLASNHVHTVELGRTVDGEKGDKPVTDVVLDGSELLAWGLNSPLREFNKTIAELQARRKIKPVTLESGEISYFTTR